MTAALAVVLPLALAGAVSPMLLTEQTVLLGASGRKAANQFAAGAILTLVAFVILVVFAGHAIKLPTAPTLSATLDVVLGVLLVVIGLAIHLAGDRSRLFQKPKQATEAKRDSGEAELASGRRRAAFPFGVFSMATNFTTLALVLVAGKEISASDQGAAVELMLAAIVVVLCSLPVWLPLLAVRLAPVAGQRLIERAHRLIADYGRTALVLLLVAAGVFLIARGTFNL